MVKRSEVGFIADTWIEFLQHSLKKDVAEIQPAISLSFNQVENFAETFPNLNLATNFGDNFLYMHFCTYLSVLTVTEDGIRSGITCRHRTLLQHVPEK